MQTTFVHLSLNYSSTPITSGKLKGKKCIMFSTSPSDQGQESLITLNTPSHYPFSEIFVSESKASYSVWLNRNTKPLLVGAEIGAATLGVPKDILVTESSYT